MVAGSRIHGLDGRRIPFREISIIHLQTGAVCGRAHLADGYTPEPISEWVRRILAAEAEAKEIEQALASGKCHPDPSIRRCPHVLLTVHAFHKNDFDAAAQSATFMLPPRIAAHGKG